MEIKTAEVCMGAVVGSSAALDCVCFHCRSHRVAQRRFLTLIGTAAAQLKAAWADLPNAESKEMVAQRLARYMTRIQAAGGAHLPELAEALRRQFTPDELAVLEWVQLHAAHWSQAMHNVTQFEGVWFQHLEKGMRQ